MASQRLRSPLGQAIGLGSAREGVAHWWAQRVTAIALVPLVLWFVIAVIGLAGADRATLTEWLHHPVPTVLWMLLLVATFYHAALGLQVVIEDYIENEALRLGLLMIMKFAVLLIAALGIFSLLKLSLA
jgi:succinate dehydrogenase / fumarate reductase membrane anchor subunit